MQEIQTHNGILDWETVLKKSEIPPESLEELAGLFLTEAPKLMAEMREALQQKDTTQLRRAAHTLKSSALLFEARPTADTAMRLENLAKQDDLETAQSTFPELEREVERLTPLLQEHVSQKEPAGGRQ